MTVKTDTNISTNVYEYVHRQTVALNTDVTTIVYRQQLYLFQICSGVFIRLFLLIKDPSMTRRLTRLTLMVFLKLSLCL